MLLNCGSKETLILLWSWKVKSNESFTQQQFAIEGLPFRRDRNALGVGVMIFVREDIPVKEVFCDNVALNIEGIFVEINL